MSRRSSSDVMRSTQLGRVVDRSRRQSEAEWRPADIQTSQLPGRAIIDLTLSTPPGTPNAARPGGILSAGRSSSGDVSPSSALVNCHLSPTVPPSPGPQQQQPPANKRKETPESDAQGHLRKKSRIPAPPVSAANTAVRNPSYSPSETRQIPRRELQTGARVGKGGYGDVYQGTWSRQFGVDGVVTVEESVAVKKVSGADDESKSDDAAERQKASFEQEVAHLQQHVCERGKEHVVQILGVSVDESLHLHERHWLVMELASHGSLSGYLKARAQPKAISVTMRERLALCLQCVEAVSYLHSHSPPILHRDIKPHNFLVFDRINGGGVQVKIGDFGLAQTRSESAVASSYQGHAGTENYLAPELKKKGKDGQGGKPSKAADIYSIGVLMWVVCTGLQVPTVNRTRTKIPGVPPPLHALINRCWATQAVRRPLNCKEIETKLAQIISDVSPSESSSVSASSESLSAAAPSSVASESVAMSDIPTTASVSVETEMVSASHDQQDEASPPPPVSAQSLLATADAPALLAFAAAQTFRGIQAGVQGVQAVVSAVASFSRASVYT